MTNERKQDRTILVAGATGQQGGAVARQLLERGYDVRALTRNPNGDEARRLEELGARLVKGDMNERADMDRAVEGAWGVYSVQNTWTAGVDGERQQGKNLAEAARSAGVEHYVYSSVASAWNDTGLPHFDVKRDLEEHLRGTGLRYTILRPVWFMENWAGFRDAILDGTLPLPVDPGMSLQQIAVHDIGVFAALAFDDPEGYADRALDLAGDELTMAETAETLANAIGENVTYRQVDWDTYREQAGDEMADMWRWFQDTGYEADIEELRTMHPKLIRFQEFLRTAEWLPAGAEA